jgi:general secretion pathway protein G
VLHSNLFTLRTQIQNYVIDRQRAPLTLDALVQDGYLMELPMDPITGTRDWRTIPEDPLQAVDQAEPGIMNVRSTSTHTSPLNGRPYAEW